MVSENLLIVVVEAGQQLEGPCGRCLHRVRHVLIGRHTAAAGADNVASATTSGDTACGPAGAPVGDARGTADGDVVDPVATDLPPGRRCLLPL